MKTECVSGSSLPSTISSFNTTTTGSCTAPTGLRRSADGKLLIWDAVPGALAYQVEVELEESATDWKFKRTTADNSIMLPSDMPSGYFEAKVKAICLGGESPYSSILPFSAATGNPAVGFRSQSGQGITMSDLSIFPQPATTQLQLRLGNLTDQSVTVDLISVSGQLMERRQFDRLDQSTLSWDVSQYPAGWYALRVTSGKIQITQPVIIQSTK